MSISAISLRKPAIAALALAAVVGLTACGGSATAGSSATADAAKAPLFSQLPQDIQSAGTIKVASNVEYPPFESIDKDGKTIVGIDRELADAVEKQLGVTLAFDNIAFDAIIPGLASGRYSMGMSAMSDTKERQKQVSFLDYFKAGAGIMTTKANADKLKSLDDLCGTKVGIVKGTTEDADATAQSGKCEAAGKAPLAVTIYAGQNQAVLALQSERVDAFLVDSTSGSVVAAESNGELAMGKAYEEGYFGIVFPKESTQLMTAVQKAMEQIKADGSYEAILAKYKMDDHAVDTFTVNGATK
ncbi:ABC transporter substrate-binding protein [Arthrobacter cavernae]|uniref:ABC transporter substrate-binding protein n=1 Tax=Arthrobacter cavernae TaxID=2817681 RepID=A0A939KJZ6_9MICC|nr:ABC transporter substrate-binding protein [Arthrobacter cavernae]MBO1269202.1 ABC transporter substrate-binding protein [Arthrobacter cavernae]